MTTDTQYYSIEDIKTANARAGQHYFEPSTMRFFDSRVLGTVYHGRYFITSERFHGSNGYDGDRCYTIREAKPNGSIDTVGPFNELRTARTAERWIQRIIDSGITRTDDADWKRCEVADCDHVARYATTRGMHVCNDHLLDVVKAEERNDRS